MDINKCVNCKYCKDILKDDGYYYLTCLFNKCNIDLTNDLKREKEEALQMGFNQYNSKDIDRILTLLTTAKNTAIANRDYDTTSFFEVLIEIVNEWKYDNSQWNFKQDHYRQAVSFLMWIAEDTGATENDCPEYFEARFFNRLKSYKALEHRFNERLERGKKRRG